MKIYEVLAVRHLYFLAVRKKNLITACAHKNKSTACMLVSARKDHSLALIFKTIKFDGNSLELESYRNTATEEKHTNRKSIANHLEEICSVKTIVILSLLYLYKK